MCLLCHEGSMVEHKDIQVSERVKAQGDLGGLWTLYL